MKVLPFGWYCRLCGRPGRRPPWAKVGLTSLCADCINRLTDSDYIMELELQIHCMDRPLRMVGTQRS